MNREIKYKAWDKKEKRMFNVASIDITDGSCKQHLFGEYYDFWNDVILLEYTGLHDYNGNEIYEGDIVKKEFMEQWLEDTTLIGVVTMVEGCWCVLDEENKKIEPLWSETDINTIIGNKFDK